jgi:RNA polymerase sigma-70 factor (ECF subfamily)
MALALHIPADDRTIPGVPEDVETLEDATLARRIAAAGAALDSAAETELYRRLAPRVRLYGLRHLRDRHAAHDLMQQVLLMTLEALRAGKLREPERIASFVLGMCRMVVLEIRRGTWRRETLLETYGNTAEAVEVPEPPALDADKLAGCLQALAERERTVVVQTFFADRSGDDVAKELGLSAGNVRVIRHRALARLRVCMDGGAS